MPFIGLLYYDVIHFLVSEWQTMPKTLMLGRTLESGRNWLPDQCDVFITDRTPSKFTLKRNSEEDFASPKNAHKTFLGEYVTIFQKQKVKEVSTIVYMNISTNNYCD